MTAKTLTFEATRGGIHNTQHVELYEDMIEQPGGGERLHIDITLDSIGDTGMDTRIGVHGFGDINELAEYLIQLGHQIGHDLGGTCHLPTPEINIDSLPDEVVEQVIGGLMTGLEQARQEQSTTRNDKAGQ